MNSGPTPPISEIVTFLHTFAPGTLEKVRSETPAALLGQLEYGGLAAVSDPLLDARAKVAVSALAEILPAAERAIVVIRKKLRSASRLRLITELLSLLGSGYVATKTALTSTIGLDVTVAGAASFVGALCTIIVRYYETTPQQNGKPLQEIHVRLGGATYEARQLQAELKALDPVQLDARGEARLVELIGQTNQLCREIQQSLSILLADSAPPA